MKARAVARLVLLIAACCVAFASVLLTQEPPTKAPGETAAFAAEFERRLHEARKAAGLRALTAHRALHTVAARQAEWLATRKELTLQLPQGATLDLWLEQAGYRAGLSTAKLGSTNQTPKLFLASWIAHPEVSSGSLFHPEVRHFGAAVAHRRGSGDGQVERVVVVILATPRDALVAERYAALGDRAAIREQFLAEVNRARAGFSRSPLQNHPLLDAAADRFAAQLAAREGGVALKSGAMQIAAPSDTAPSRPRRRAKPLDLIDLVRREGYRAARVQANELRGTVSASAVVEAWMRSAEQQDNLLSDVIRDLGTGSWIGHIDGELQVLWVQVYARPGTF